MAEDIWKIANDLNIEYDSLNLNNSVIDYEKYKLYSIVTSSTQLEGSTLTEVDTQLLLDEGITAQGKPIEHHLMVKDNYEAIKYAMKSGDEQLLLSTEFLKKLNSLNSPHSVEIFCNDYNNKMVNNKGIELLKYSFEAHAVLILIHPWQDGNKRTSRLLMNFMQRRGRLPLTKVHKEDSKQYIESLKTLKDTGSFDPILTFMAGQHIKTISNEIESYKQINSKRSNTLYFL